jgi:hypothetical protein
MVSTGVQVAHHCTYYSHLSSLVRVCFARVRPRVYVGICELQSVVLHGIASAFTIIRCL